MKSNAKTVEQFLKSLPADRREAISTVRKIILKNLPRGYVEQVIGGMPVYVVPLSVLPDTYNGWPLAYAALASHKDFMTLYLMNVYSHKPTEKWFRAQFQAAGKKLDMGKCCVHFKTLDDLPLEVIGQVIARTPMDAYIRAYHQSRAKTKSGARARSRKPPRK
ncbi:MAG TPA: DUF1801 domain-containing protein [Candidatus Acidoferrales bacterium]